MPPGERDVSILPCGDAAVPVRPRVETDGTALPKRFEPALTLRIGGALAGLCFRPSPVSCWPGWLKAACAATSSLGQVGERA